MILGLVKARQLQLQWEEVVSNVEIGFNNEHRLRRRWVEKRAE